MVSLSFFFYDLASYQQATEAKLSAVAGVLAKNSADALFFDHPVHAYRPPDASVNDRRFGG